MSDKTVMAERTIAQALAELEQATEGYVRAVDIIDIETTDYADERVQRQRRVAIELEPKPGTNWSV